MMPLGVPIAARAPSRSVHVDIIQKLHETRVTRQRTPDVTFEVMKINVRGKRQRRAITITWDAVLNQKQRFRFRRSAGGRVSAGADIAVISSDTVTSMSPDKTQSAPASADKRDTRYYTSRRLPFTDIAAVVMDDDCTVRILMKRRHDYVYESQLAVLIHREITRRFDLFHEHKQLESKVAARMSVSLTELTASLLHDPPADAKPTDGGPTSPEPIVVSTAPRRRVFQDPQCETVITSLDKILYDPKSAEGRTRARLLQTDFPKALQDSIATLKAETTAQYIKTAIAPEIAAVKSSRTSSVSSVARSPSTWFAWMSRKTFIEPGHEDSFATPPAPSPPTDYSTPVKQLTSPMLATVVEWSSAEEATLLDEKPNITTDDAYSDDMSSGLSTDSQSDRSPEDFRGESPIGVNAATSTVVPIAAAMKEAIEVLTTYVLTKREDQLREVSGSLPWSDDDLTPVSSPLAESKSATEHSRAAFSDPTSLEAAIVGLIRPLDIAPTVSRLVAREIEASFYSVVSLRHGVATVINYIVDTAYSSEVTQKMSLLRKCGQSFFGVAPHLQRSDNWELAVQQLRRAEKVPSPTDKLYMIQLAVKAIYELYARTITVTVPGRRPISFRELEPLGADDLFPIFAFVAVQARLLAPVHLNKVIWLFADPAELRSQGGYWMTVYEAALEYIRTVPLPAVTKE